MRRALLLISLVLSACVGQTTTPSPSPTPATSVTTTPTATPSASPSPTPRLVRPFFRVVPLTLTEAAGAAIDTERVALIEGPAGARRLEVVDVATGRSSTVYTAAPGWVIELSHRGLRGETLVFTERRFEGGRTDGRAIRVDLGTKTTSVLDEWSGPFLGGGDVWNPEPAITNGTDVLWTRITSDRRPFAVDVVLAASVGPARVLRTSESATWVDLDDSGRVAVSTLITAGDRAQLELWTAGQFRTLGTRPSPEGGAARFVGDRVLWVVGSGIVRRIERIQLVGSDGSLRDVDTGSCFWRGVAGRYVMLGCGSGTNQLLDPATGARGDEIASFNQMGAPRAALWREGSQWWLGILGP